MPLGFLDVLNPLDTVVSHFFSFSSEIVNNILSHMCGRLYFPMFLFRVGLLTLIDMASWMVLATLFSSLPRILKLSIDVLWPLMFLWWNIGEGVFKCSLNLSPKVLPDSPNFAITPQRPPHGKYIKPIETACQSLDAKSAEELRSDVYRVLRHPHQLRPNVSKGEMTVIKQLKADKERISITADKGVVLVIME